MDGGKRDLEATAPCWAAPSPSTGIACEVIGVLPPNFTFLDRNAAFLLPLQLDRNKTILGNVSYEGIARLKPGVTIEQAAADIARLIPIALHSYPPQPGFTVKAFEDVRFAPRLEYLKAKPDRRSFKNPMGADGDHWNRASDRLRQRCQSAAGSRRRPAA